METLTLNKSNWSGEDAKIKLYSNGNTGSIPSYGLKFRVVESGTFVDASVDLNLTEYKIELNDNGKWTETDWKVSTDRSRRGSDWHYATNWDGSISRESTKDVRLAVVQLIFMLY